MDFIQGEVFAIDKPYGMSSFGALARVRYLLSRKLGRKIKIGHAGTLDPLATGVLILCTGKCTKQIEELQSHTKEYVATLQLGATTDSYDREHTVNHTYPVRHITEEMIRSVLGQFEGAIDQVPPTYSAVKVDGKRAYSIRRKGNSVELQAKRIFIEKLELTGYDAHTHQMSIHVVCGKGTYIRALARDLGRALGSGAFLTDLRRTRVGNYDEAHSIDFDQLEEWVNCVEVTSENKQA